MCAEEKESIVCALVCPGCLLFGGLIHHVLLMESSSMLFSSLISLWCALLVGSKLVSVISGVVPCTINSEAQSPWSNKLSLLSQF